MIDQEQIHDSTESMGEAQFDRLPLSFAQERLWFLNELEPGSAVYNLPGAVIIRGELDVRHVERALNFVIARHENLRTVFSSEDGRPYQRILDRLDFKLERIDLSHFGIREARENEAKRLCRADAARPFDLVNGPLLRGKVFKLSGHEHILMLNLHHIISDGWSTGILLKELRVILEAFRQGRNPELPPLPIQYADYSIWQRQWLEEGGILAQQLAYWQAKLAGTPETLDLVLDFPRPDVATYAGASHSFALDAQLTGQLKRIAEQQGATLFMVLLAAFKVLLYRYTGQNDLCVGTPIANRQYGETEGLIGLFINTLAMRTRVEGSDTFPELLAKVKSTCLEAYENQDAPFEKVVDVLRLQRNLAISPLFQVMLILQNTEPPAVDALIKPYPLDSGISKFDLTLELTESPEGLSASIRYSTALYERQTIARLAEHFSSLVRAIVASPAAPMQELDYQGEAERQQLLTVFNGGPDAEGKSQCLHDLFAEQVARCGDRTSVVCGDGQLTYQQLEERSRELALVLQAEGVGPDDLVALCVERSLDMVVGLLGILRAGGAYVPLDPDYPDDRIAYMVRDSRASVVLTQAALKDRLRALIPDETRVVALDREWPEIAARAAALSANQVRLEQQVQPHHLAYVIYTSGSTGRPKGVMVEHGNAVSYVTAIQDRLQIPDGSSFALASTFAADLGNTVLFPSLLGGGTLHVLSSETATDARAYAAYCRKHRIDCMKVTPSHLQALVAERTDRYLVPAHTLVLGGEVLSPGLVQWIRELNPACRVFNHYGPTECTVGVLSGEAPVATRRRHVPLGFPLAGTRIYIVDGQGQPVPVGVAGELLIGGAQVSRGYLNRPELTAERFFPDRFSTASGARVYKTGDMARWSAEGAVEYLGRNDFQVKIRGFRIEPGEIEAQLSKHAAVKEALVMAREDDPGDKRLVAYVTLAEPAGVDALRAHLQARVPQIMVPSAFVILDAMPLTPNGKVDRKALPRPEVQAHASEAYEPPQGSVEETLCAIWQELLRVGRVGRSDNFFELGGHSLLATRLMSKIRSRIGVDLPLKALFEGGTVAQLARAIARAESNDIPPIVPADRTQYDYLPLSFAQERLWFLNQLAPDTASYNILRAVKIRGAVDLAQVEAAFNFIIARHESLRTVFPNVDGQAYQKILENVDFKLARIDLRGYDREWSEAEARRLCEAEAATPFDLGSGPLIRVMAIRLAEDEHILTLNLHHIISDGWSHPVLIRELGAVMAGLSEGRRPDLPPLPIQYADYSVWQRRWLEQSGVLERQLGYWRQKLAGVPESLALPTDFPRPGVQTYAGANHPFALGAELTGRLKRIAEQQGATLYMVLLAAFKALLYRYTAQNDICVGSPIANRQYGETEGLIGMFVNTLAMRSQVEGRDSFAALLEKVKTTCLEAYEHQDAPFERVVDELHVQRNLAITPLFQVMLILQNNERAEVDASMELYPLDGNISKFDLTAVFSSTPEGLDAVFEYNTALYRPETIARMAEHFAALCEAITAAPTAEVGALDYLGEAEKHALVAGFNDTAADYPLEQCIHHLFDQQVARNAAKTAVVCGDEQLTYQELLARSRELALYLQSEGVRPDSLVGVCMERSLEMVVALFGILEAGGAYVPLDPDYPDDRLAHMVSDSRAAIVLTQERLREKLAPLVAAGTQIVALDAQGPQIGERVSALKAAGVALRQEAGPHHLAYVIYTSGSTGRPKGVMNEHRGVVNRLLWMQEAYGLGERDAVLQKTPFSFDVSVWEFFWTLSTGATLVMARPEGHKDPAYLTDTIVRHGITTLHFVPPMLQVFLEHGEAEQCVSLERVVCSGEALPSSVVRRFAERLPHAVLYNLYGPTEAAVDVTEWTCPATDIPEAIPIGRPIANTQIYILDGQGAPVPAGVAGELHIAGVQVARGYLNRPQLTAERFVADPFAGRAGARMYKTGDLARWLDDGTIQYLGRIDTQVKVRGFRIEMGEIEARLHQHLGIQEAVVIAKGEGANKQLIAFYRATETASDQVVQLPAEELRSHLSQTLPDYMVPAAFVSLAAIPLSPNGKVDRRALAGMDVTAAASREYVAPRNEIESQLVAIWAGILNLAPERIGIDDNFFEVGGHSLLATRLISKIRSRFTVDLPLKALFESGSVAQLAERIAKAERQAGPAIVPIDRKQYDRLPLSFAQERVWFLSQLAPDTAGYNIPGAVRIRGALNVAQVEEAFDYVIARHENLRTVFPSDDGQARQQILDAVDFKLQRIDLSGYDSEWTEAEAKRLCQSEAATPFDLTNGPLIRGMVIKLAGDEHILMLTLHHIISDGWSTGVLLRELGAVIDASSEGRLPELPPLPIQYADYSVWQRRWLEESGVLERQLGYWQQKLAGAPESLALPTDFPRPVVQTYGGANHPFAVDADLTAGLKRIAEQHGGTLYMVLLAAFKALLHRYTGQNDICVGSPIANRQYGETEGLIGMFVNTLAMRSRVEGSDSFAAVLEKVKTTCLEAYEHQDAPFEKVVDALHLQRNLASTPLFQVMVILQNTERPAADASIQPYPLDGGVSKFDLTVVFSETADGLEAIFEYNTELYKAETIARMAGHFTALCQALTAAPTAEVGALDYLGEAEKHALLAGYNDTAADYPRDVCLHELFTAQAARSGEKTAVVCGEERLTYRQLDERSRDLALVLQSQGVGPDSLVGVCMERSLDMVVSLLGILRAGGAYVPLDPEYPNERLAYMLRDSGAAIVLTQESLLEKLGGLAAAGTRMIALDRERPETAGGALQQHVRPHHLAYLIYTSGSTGQPKGVAIEHHSPVTLVQWGLEVYSNEELAGVLASTSICFDLSVYEIFLTLASGGTMILVRNAMALAEGWDGEAITLINTVPSAMEELVRLGAVPESVRTINLAGEPLTARLVDGIYETTAAGKVYDLYGPSEDTTYSTYVLRTPNGPQTIGRPIANTRVYILDARNQLQPIGVPGELHIAGDGLARGYLNRPELTGEKFVANPFEPGTRMYRTGDLARWLDNGTIQYLGRIDTQVKVRGFRIEMGEIEARLHQHLGIQDAVVIAQGEGASKQLIAFYRAKETTPGQLVQLPAEELRSHLSQTLPDYMVPAAFVSLAAIPLSPNGKVDRRALAGMDVMAAATSREYVAPRNETESQLVAIWAEVLNLVPERIGIHDNFFEVGGHSLLAMRLIAKIRSRFTVDLPLKVLFEGGSVAQLAEQIARAETQARPAIVPVDRTRSANRHFPALDVASLTTLISSEAAPSFEVVIPLQPHGDAPPVFAVPGAGGNVFSLRPLGQSLGDQQPLFAFRAAGLDGRTPPFSSVEQTAQANVAAMKTVQPIGPYRLVGHSYGGVVAYEMARILLEQGEEVSSLTLLDSLAPSLMRGRPVHDEVNDLVEACRAVADLDGAMPEIDLEQLRRSTFEEVIQSFAGLLNDRGLEIDTEQLTTFYGVYRANLLCYHAYTPSLLPRAIDVSLYRATQGRADRRSLPRDYGWDELLPSPIRTSDVAADHYSILSKVSVRDGDGAVHAAPAVVGAT